MGPTLPPLQLTRCCLHSKCIAACVADMSLPLQLTRCHLRSERIAIFVAEILHTALMREDRAVRLHLPMPPAEACVLCAVKLEGRIFTVL